MEDNKHISDELLAKYLSGKASAEEEERVLDYLAENDENLEDFLTMATAAKMQRQEEQIPEKHHHYWIKWAAAAAAVVSSAAPVTVVVVVFPFSVMVVVVVVFPLTVTVEVEVDVDVHAVRHNTAARVNSCFFTVSSLCIQRFSQF